MAQYVFLGVEYFLGSRERRKKLSGNESIHSLYIVGLMDSQQANLL